MKLSIKKFAEITGVSVRTLHYYDEIGLLKPDFVDEQTGYRFYGTAALNRMQEILFFRELDFSLKSIKDIISSPSYNKAQALSMQKELLMLKKERLEQLIEAIEKAEKGEAKMDFKAFEKDKINAYKDEVKQRWGNTDAYKEHNKKTASYSDKNWNDAQVSLNGIIAEFALALKTGVKPNSSKAASLTQKLQDFITATQYTCTNEILLCLGDMYVADERFKNNIDTHGEGTAEFMNKAIKHYYKSRN